MEGLPMKNYRSKADEGAQETVEQIVLTMKSRKGSKKSKSKKHSHRKHSSRKSRKDSSVKQERSEKSSFSKRMERKCVKFADYSILMIINRN